MRHIFIGDIHGMLDSLNSLLDQLDLQQDDVIVFVGDLLDKGPDSVGVVGRVRSLADSHNVILVKGNHEDTHARYRKHLKSNSNIAKQMAANKPEIAQINDRLSDDDVAFLDAAVLFHRIPDLNVTVVHGGICSNIKQLPDSVDTMSSLSGKLRKALKLVMFTRHVNADTGHFVGLGQERDVDPFWADVYDGRFGHVIFGHQPFIDGVKHFNHATGIDSGAVQGGSLSSLIINKDGKRSVVSVKCNN